MLALKTLSIVVGLIALNSIRQTEGITYQSNTYELNVALSEYALDIPAAERGQFLQNMKVSDEKVPFFFLRSFYSHIFPMSGHLHASVAFPV